ncbi:hypothetical protein GGU10DRAFT_337635, partial [Lentinula aff. detonsa]
TGYFDDSCDIPPEAVIEHVLSEGKETMEGVVEMEDGCLVRVAEAEDPDTVIPEVNIEVEEKEEELGRGKRVRIASSRLNSKDWEWTNDRDVSDEDGGQKKRRKLLKKILKAIAPGILDNLGIAEIVYLYLDIRIEIASSSAKEEICSLVTKFAIEVVRCARNRFKGDGCKGVQSDGRSAWNKIELLVKIIVRKKLEIVTISHSQLIHDERRQSHHSSLVLVLTVSGNLESPHPIQSVCEKRTYTSSTRPSMELHRAPDVYLALDKYLSGAMLATTIRDLQNSWIKFVPLESGAWGKMSQERLE